MFLEAIGFILLSFVLIYVILILVFNVSWYSIRKYIPEGKQLHTTVTVIISARNESANIMLCLNHLKAQTYNQNLQIIVVDDHSHDNTPELIEEFIANNNNINISLIKLYDTPETYAYKKRAISEAMKISTGELIITTDADCVMNKHWLATIVEYYEKYSPKMIVSPVIFMNNNTLFQQMQSLEFSSLVASTAASINLNIPLMCNGANLCYQRSAFDEVGGYQDTHNFASGDDIFLLLKIKKRFKNSVKFIKADEVIVYTESKHNLKELISQRKRWVSKSKAYTDFFILFVAMIVFMANMSIIATLVTALFVPKFWLLFILLFTIKSLAELPLLWGITKFTKQKEIIKIFPLLQLIYFIYVFLISIAGLTGKYYWKSRLVK